MDIPAGYDASVWKALPVDIRQELLNSAQNSQLNVMDLTQDTSQKKVLDHDDKDTKKEESALDFNDMSWTNQSRSPLSSKGMLSSFLAGKKQEEKEALFYDLDFPPNVSSIDGIDGPDPLLADIATTNTNKDNNDNNDSIKNNSSSSSSSRDHCKCTPPCAVKVSRVSKEGKNNGRLYKTCPLPWKDPNRCDFFSWVKPDEAAFYARKGRVRTLTWQRFGASEGYRMCIQGRFKSESILQGKVGDCWFLSAVAVVSEREDLIKSIIQDYPAIPANGKLTFNFYVDGVLTPVIIDNYLPVASTATSQYNKSVKRPKAVTANTNMTSILEFSNCARQGVLWVPFLEKAYAKIYGSYHAISGGWIHEAMFDLTGAPCESIDFSSPSFDSEATWHRLLSFHAAGFPMGCATNMSRDGIVGHHAYSILDIKELSLESIGSFGQQRSMRDYHTSTTVKSTTGDSQILHIFDSTGKTISPNPRNKHPNDAKKHKVALDDHISDSGSLRMMRIRNPWGKQEFKGFLSTSDDEYYNSTLKALLPQGVKNDGTFWCSYHDVLTHFADIDVCKADNTGTWRSQGYADIAPLYSSKNKKATTYDNNNNNNDNNDNNKSSKDAKDGLPSHGGDNAIIVAPTPLLPGPHRLRCQRCFLFTITEQQGLYALSNCSIPHPHCGNGNDNDNNNNDDTQSNLSYRLCPSLSTLLLAHPGMVWSYFTVIQQSKRGRNRTAKDHQYFYLPMCIMVERMVLQDDAGNSHVSNIDHGTATHDAEHDQKGAKNSPLKAASAHLLSLDFFTPQRTSRPLELHLPPGTYCLSILKCTTVNTQEQPYILRTYSSKDIRMEGCTSESVRRAGMIPSRNMFDKDRALLMILKEASMSFTCDLSNAYGNANTTSENDKRDGDKEVIDVDNETILATHSTKRHHNHSISRTSVNGKLGSNHEAPFYLCKALVQNHTHLLLLRSGLGTGRSTGLSFLIVQNNNLSAVTVAFEICTANSVVESPWLYGRKQEQYAMSHVDDGMESGEGKEENQETMMENLEQAVMLQAIRQSLVESGMSPEQVEIEMTTHLQQHEQQQQQQTDAKNNGIDNIKHSNKGKGSMKKKLYSTQHIKLQVPSATFMVCALINKQHQWQTGVSIPSPNCHLSGGRYDSSGRSGNAGGDILVRIDMRHYSVEVLDGREGVNKKRALQSQDYNGIFEPVSI